MKLEIFKVGKHTSSSGATKNYSVEDLNQIVSNHSEPTPITVGHPKTNSPAFGWIKNLFVEGESLFAVASDLVPEFLDLVKQKIYKNRSVSLNNNDDGTLSLRHVAFLGGTMPAVKGLKDIEFSSDEAETFEFALNLIIEKEKVIPKKEDESNSNNFSEAITSLQDQMKKLTEFVETIQPSKRIELSEMQTKIDELNIKLDAAYYQRNVQDKIDFSSLTPAIKTKLETLLGYFESLDFSEEQNSKVIADFQELADLIQPFQTDEVLKKVEFEKNTKDNPNEFSQMNVDKESLILFNEATEYAKENEVSFSDAVNVLINKNSEVQ